MPTRQVLSRLQIAVLARASTTGRFAFRIDRTLCSQQKGMAYRKQTERAAERIGELPLPRGTADVGLGDTAFDAEAIRLACVKRDFTGIVPIDPERVLAGEKPRPQVRMLANEWTAKPFPAIRLDPNTGTVAMRRLSKYRVGPKIQSRIDSAHSENRDVHSVGKVRLVFSTRENPTAAERPDVQKILMPNDRSRSQAEVVEWYDLRGQIEWFFEELKSTRGLAPYRFRQFAKVEGGRERIGETGRTDRGVPGGRLANPRRHPPSSETTRRRHPNRIPHGVVK